MHTEFLVKNHNTYTKFHSYIEASNFAQDLSKKEPGRKIAIYSPIAVLVSHNDQVQNKLITEIEDLF